MYKTLLRPLLFKFDSEKVHHIALGAARISNSLGLCPLIKSTYSFEDPALNSTCWGLNFCNPIGLAAGFDKDAKAVEFFGALGFAFLELGTVTAQSQPGNPKPRIFKFPSDLALINRMGFPSEGSEVMASRLSKLRNSPNLPILGVNLGKTKIVPLDSALDDYRFTFARVKDLADFVVLNVSSPNTPELRRLQERPRLEELFRGIQADNTRGVPLLVKIAPDLETSALEDILDCCMAVGISGIVATNTTFARAGLRTATEEVGGLSGHPLRARALEMVRFIYRNTQGRLPIVGVGGVFSGRDAYNLIAAGASLVQIYTGLVFEGPGLVKQVKAELLRIMKENGVAQLQDLIGKAQ